MRITKKAVIEKKIKDLKSFKKEVKKNKSFTEDELLEGLFFDCLRYIEGIKENRIICIVKSVSKSGMTIHLDFVECHKIRTKRYQAMSFIKMFKLLGFCVNEKKFTVVVKGCGMATGILTHCTVINILCQLGFISVKQRDIFTQDPPITV